MQIQKLFVIHLGAPFCPTLSWYHTIGRKVIVRGLEILITINSDVPTCRDRAAQMLSFFYLVLLPGAWCGAIVTGSGSVAMVTNWSRRTTLSRELLIVNSPL